jgi:two-component system, NarL family, sensor kinase
MRHIKHILIIFGSLFCGSLFAQQTLLAGKNDKVDSLVKLLGQSHHDTIKARAYISLSMIYAGSKPDTIIPLSDRVIAIADKAIPNANSIEKRSLLISKAAAISNKGFIYQQLGQTDKALDHFGQALKLQEESGDEQEIANTIGNIGTIYFRLGETSKALDAFRRALDIQERINSKPSIAYSLNNIGAIYESQGQIPKALEYYFKGLKIQESLGNKTGIGTSMNNIAALYQKQGDPEKALEFYTISLKAREEIGDKRGIAQCLNNIGHLHTSKKQYAKALEQFNKSYAIYEEIGNQQGLAYSLNNIAAIHQAEGEVQKSLELYLKSATMYEAVGDKRGMATALNNVGVTYLKLNEPKKAKAYSLRSLETSSSAKYAEMLRDAHGTLSKIDSALGLTASAMAHYKAYVIFKDSLSNINIRKAALKKQFQYDYEQKEAADKLEQEKKEALHNEALKRQRLITWSILVGIGLVFLSSVLLFNRHRLKQKNKYQTELNEQQKKQADAVMETQEQERKRIAEDLHDSLGHLLSTAKLNLQAMPVGQKQVENSLQLIHQASEEIRNITFNLMPRTLEEGGLIPALNELATKVTNTGAVKVNLHVHDMGKFVLEKQSQFNVYRIIQEAVNNILKHAEASEINIQLIGQLDHFTIMIEDDGKGFNPETNKNGRGLKNILTRSLWLKGNINIDSTPGRGTTITTEIPV